MRWPTKGSYVDAWRGIFREGPTALLDEMLATFEYQLDAGTKEVIRAFFGHVKEQTEWIVKAREELVSEAARVRELGESMRKAGLRSYTDKEGRIYVAGPPEGDE